MDISFYKIWFMGAVIMGAFYVTLVTNRPFQFLARWLFWFLVLAFLPSLAPNLQRLLVGQSAPQFPGAREGFSFEMPGFIGHVLVIMAALYVIMGLRALVTRRPSLFPARWLFWFLVLDFLNSPDLAHRLQLLLVGQLWPMVQPLTRVVILAMFWMQMRGYLIYGITENSFRNALNAALDGLNLWHDESLSRIRLPDVGADLQVSIQTWMSQGQIRIRPSRQSATLNQIADGMKQYLATAPVQTNMLTPLCYVVLGLLTAGFAVAFFHSMGLPPHRFDMPK